MQLQIASGNAVRVMLQVMMASARRAQAERIFARTGLVAVPRDAILATRSRDMVVCRVTSQPPILSGQMSQVVHPDARRATARLAASARNALTSSTRSRIGAETKAKFARGSATRDTS